MDTYDVPILSVNRGTLGFLAETALDEAETIIPKLLGGKGKIEKRSLLAVRAQRGKRILYSGYVLNEAVISQGAIARLIDLKTMVQGEHLTTFHADGVILATPTGSTAYSLAAGGPIVHPRLPCTIVTPINPHSFTQKPIVLPHDQSVHIEVMTKDNKFSDVRVSLTLDGQTYVTLKRGDVVSAALDGTTVKFLRRKEDTFYETLRNKLKWGEGL
jgi:NAD+ kinase